MGGFCLGGGAGGGSSIGKGSATNRALKYVLRNHHKNEGAIGML